MSAEVTLAHVNLNGFETGSHAGVERVLLTQRTILLERGIAVSIIAGSTDHPNPLQAGIFVLQQIDSGRYLNWRQLKADTQIAIIQEIMSKIFEIVPKDGVFFAHNTTNMATHNPLWGIAAANILTEMARNGGVAVLGIHDSRKAAVEDMSVFLPGDERVIIACVSGVRKTQLEQKLAQMRTQGYPIPDYIEVLVLPNPIDQIHLQPLSNRPCTLHELAPNFMTQESSPQELVERLIFDNNIPILTVPARIAEQKGIEYAITVAEAYARKYGEILLAITGPIDMRKEKNLRYWEQIRLQLQTVDNPSLHIAFLGGMQWDFLPWFFKRTTVSLMPFVDEGFAMPIAESMLQSTPVMISTDQAMLETSGGHALVIPRDEWMQKADETASRLHQYLSSDKPEQHCRAMRIKVERSYSPQAVSEQLQYVLRLV